MAQLARDEAGNVWEVDAQGNAVRLVTPASAPAGPQVVMPESPVVAAKNASELAGEALTQRRTAQQIARDAVTAPYDARTAAANATKAEADATKAQRDLAAQQATVSPQQQKAMAALGNDEILAAITKARDNLNRTGAAGYAARLPSFMQPQSAVDLEGSLNTIASRLTLDKLSQLKQASPTGASGLGSLTEQEGKLLRDSVAGLGQTQSPEQLRENLAAVEKHYRNFMALTAGEDYRNPEVAKKYGIAAMPAGGATGDTLALATGGMRTEADPALRGVNNHIRGMIGDGRSAADIVAYMNSIQPGLGDQRAGDVSAAVKFRAQNPTVPLSKYPVSVENRSVPMSATRQLVNTAAQTPGGAYFAAATDALTGGTVDNWQDNPALARAGMKAIAAANPTSSLLGSLSGGAIAGATAETGLGALGRFAPLAADALYGSAYGAGSTDEGSRLTGAAKGAAVGALGGMFGRQAARAAGNTLTGVRDASVQYLRDADVPLTLGQMASQSGRIGRSLKAREDRLSGFTGIGERINDQRRGGLEAFNRAAYNEGLAPIGQQAMNQTGEDAVEQAQQLVRGAYDNALGGVRLTRDRPFAVDMQGPVAAANRLPGEIGANARYTLNERIGNAFDNGGVATGNDFQQSVRALEQDARAVRNQPYGNDFGGVARGARTAMENLLERQSPGSLPAYLDANAAYRNLSVLGDATAAAMNSRGVFTPAQLGNAARTNARTFTGRMSAGTTDRPFYELQRAGQEVLPSKVPDSGTAGRIEQGGGLWSTVRSTARNAINAPLYSETTQGALNRALLDRPDAAVRLGEQVLQRQRLLGMFGRPYALQNGPFAVTPDY